MWLETVGKTIFHIKHYWGRFEFAVSRGQIHLHLLAICEKLQIFKEVYKYKENKRRQAEVLQEWVEKQLRMTASLPDTTQQEPQPVKLPKKTIPLISITLILQT